MMTEKEPISVSQLNRQVRQWLERELAEVYVIGEISNLSRPSSGHLYFSLKDESAQLRCCFFRHTHHANTPKFTDGQLVIARGRLSLYEARGEYQLIVQELLPAGIGELYQQFEQLKQKLQALGLFDNKHKRPLPNYPDSIAVVTSPTGAAIQDILTCLARRYPLAQVYIYPSEVQGKNAHIQLIRALEKANEDKKAQVIIVARGGGSIEDLWPFNHEELAYAIHQSTIPVVAGIGHETDFTIADFVADCRAATPTAAAETVTPNIVDLMNFFNKLEQRLIHFIKGYIEQQKMILNHRRAALASPKRLIASHWQNVDYLERRLEQCMQAYLQLKQHRLGMLTKDLYTKEPLSVIKQYQQVMTQAQQQMFTAMDKFLLNKYHQFKQLTLQLELVNPLSILNRGYALVSHENELVRSPQQVKPGDQVDIRLYAGTLSCAVLDNSHQNPEKRTNTLFNTNLDSVKDD